MENDTTNISYNESDTNVVMDNNTSTTVVDSPGQYNEMLNTLHTDLGFICSFLVFFTLVIILKYVYKFFNMFFVI